MPGPECFPGPYLEPDSRSTNPGITSLNHLAFDIIAWLCALASGIAVYRWRLREQTSRIAAQLRPGYFFALLGGSVAGALAAGTANLVLSGTDAAGRSILGALVGAIAAVEVWKRARGVRGSTGVIFALPVAVSIAVGRLGCHSAGLAEMTYGVPTGMPWGVDFGDGVARHPVPLYESAAMAAWALVLTAGLARRRAFAMELGFYATVGWYGAQRFAWEFLKPYAAITGSLNLFHVLSLILVAYALTMMRLHVRSAA